jgi:hypothetical protein|tara:strand:+ start:215 stop:613 length:399 start_codon:yes stop_codon:yes gene_type:complete
MTYLLAIVLLLLTGCKMSSLYPVLGATGGATVGSIGGPVGSGGGALVGYGVGKGAQLMEENQQLSDTVSALSEGDVQALVAAQMGEQQGWVEETMQGFWTTVKFCLVGLVIWQVVPLILHKRLSNGDTKKTS